MSEPIWDRPTAHALGDAAFPEFSARVRHALAWGGVTTCARLAAAPDPELLRIRGLGRGGLAEIRARVPAPVPAPGEVRCPACAGTGRVAACSRCGNALDDDGEDRAVGLCVDCQQYEWESRWHTAIAASQAQARARRAAESAQFQRECAERAAANARYDAELAARREADGTAEQYSAEAFARLRAERMTDPPEAYRA